jgi:hypothetical protein
LFGGETARVEAWICNDRDQAPAAAQLAYRVELNGQPLAAGTTAARMPRASSLCQGHLEWPTPPVAARASLTVRLALLDDANGVLHDTALELELFPPVAPLERNIAVVGPPDGKAASLVRDLGGHPVTRFTDDVDVAVIDDLEAYRQVAPVVRRRVENGATAVFLELPPGTHTVGATELTVEACGMGPRHFVSRATGHPLVRHCRAADFRFWYDPAMDRPAPLLDTLLKLTDGWTTILATGQGGWGIDWHPAAAVAERRLGHGVLRVCQVHLAGRTVNPVARQFAALLLTPTPSTAGKETRPSP